MPNIIHSFRRWNTARKREAEAARWDATADALAAKKSELALRMTQAHAEGYPKQVIDAFNDARTQYGVAERNARIIAERTRSGK